MCFETDECPAKARLRPDPLKISFTPGYLGTAYGRYDSPLAVVSWYHCRETYAGVGVPGLQKMYFAHNKDDGWRVARFIHAVEDRIQLSDHTKFWQTSDPQVVFLMPSPFWLEQAARRSLFTILLRAGINYNDWDVYGAIRHQLYGKQTYKAVCRFLAGCTDYHGTSFNGWVNVFKEVDLNASTHKQRLNLLRPGKHLITKRAYQKWQERGGDSDQNWRDAEAEIVRNANV